MHWIIFLEKKKQKNSLIHSRKLILGHRITGELNEYKKHIWTVAFLILKLFPVSILLGICRRLSCVQNVFTWILSGDRRGRFYQPHLTMEEIKCFGIQDLPQTVTTVSFFWHRMRDLTAALYRPSGLAGCLRSLACMTALLGPGDAAYSGHMSSDCLVSEKPEQVTTSGNWPVPQAQREAHTALCKCSWFFLALSAAIRGHCYLLRPLGWLPTGRILILWDLDIVLFLLFITFWKGLQNLLLPNIAK